MLRVASQGVQLAYGYRLIQNNAAYEKIIIMINFIKCKINVHEKLLDIGS